MLQSSNHPLRFFEKTVTSGEKKHKYEVDFLVKQKNKLIALEVKSGNCTEHSSLNYFYDTYKKKAANPIILTKGDLNESNGYIYMPLAMGMFL